MHNVWMVPAVTDIAANAFFKIGFNLIGLGFGWLWQLSYLVRGEWRTQLFKTFLN
jgi:hypothetical protein